MIIKYVHLFCSDPAQENGMATASTSRDQEIPVKNFMQNIDLDLIGVPWRRNVLTQLGDPEWKQIYGIYQFVEPNPPGSLAWWDYDAPPGGCPFFYGNGWLRQNPRLKGQYTFCKKADENPYPDKEPDGMCSVHIIVGNIWFPLFLSK